ncbi:hypothetical protein FACS1894113_3920 [Alphaproteobacteria bacterium]|nr:hypothetical protein FACS1894113_3920 [Alphaproteobacteria bacterium]
MPWGAHGWHRGLVCALVAKNILPGCDTADYKLKKPYLLSKKKILKCLELVDDFVPSRAYALSFVASYLERFYGGNNLQINSGI